MTSRLRSRSMLAALALLVAAFAPNGGQASRASGFVLLSIVGEDANFDRFERLHLLSLADLSVRQIGPSSEFLWNGILGNGRVFANAWPSRSVEVRGDETSDISELNGLRSAPLDLSSDDDLLFMEWDHEQVWVKSWNVESRAIQTMRTGDFSMSGINWADRGRILVVEQEDVSAGRLGRIVISDGASDEEVGPPRTGSGAAHWGSRHIASTLFVADQRATQIIRNTDGELQAIIPGWSSIGWIGETDTLLLHDGRSVAMVQGPAWNQIEVVWKLQEGSIWGADWDAQPPQA